MTNITIFHNQGIQITAKTELSPSELFELLNTDKPAVLIPTKSNENAGEEGIFLYQGTFFLTVSNKAPERKPDLVIAKPKFQ